MTTNSEYASLITCKYPEWLSEADDTSNKRVVWNFIKFRIQEATKAYGKQKANVCKSKIKNIERKLKISEEENDKCPSESTTANLEVIRLEYENLIDYITQGNIARSRITWLIISNVFVNC